MPVLRVWNTPSRWQLHALQQKDGVYLSPNGKLVGRAKAARFASDQLALACLELWLACLHSRHGHDVRVEIEEDDITPGDHSDAAILVARARSGRFAGNQSIPAGAIEAAKLEIASW